MPHEIALAHLEAHVGQRFGPSPGTLIDQGRIDRFAALTNDFQWIHVDVARATREAGGTIVHGYFTLALIPSLVESIITITGVGHAFNYGSNKVRFLAPVRAGQTVHAWLTLAALEPRGQGLLLTNRVELFADDGATPVCIAEVLGLLHEGDGRL